MIRSRVRLFGLGVLLACQTVLAESTPIAWGQAGYAYCSAVGSFEEQPTWNGSAPVGDAASPYAYADTSYANRQDYDLMQASGANSRWPFSWRAATSEMREMGFFRGSLRCRRVYIAETGPLAILLPIDDLSVIRLGNPLPPSW